MKKLRVRLAMALRDIADRLDGCESVAFALDGLSRDETRMVLHEVIPESVDRLVEATEASKRVRKEMEAIHG